MTIEQATEESEAEPEVKPAATPEVAPEAIPEVKPAATPEVAPETDYKLTIPENGGASQADADRIVSYAKEQGLSQTVAQEMLDRESIATSASQSASMERAKMLHEQWAKEARADKSFGGENFTENVNLAKRGMDSFASPELVDIFTQTGLGNNVEVLKMFKRLGELVKSDGFVSGMNSEPDTRSDGEIFYDKPK